MWEKTGIVFMLKLLEGGLPAYNPQFVLFKDNLTGSPGDHVYDASKISDFPGYARILLAYSAPPSLDVAGLGTAITNAMTWIRSSTGSSQPVKGIGLISDDAGGTEELMWYDDSFASVNMANAGDEFERVVKFGDDRLIVTP